MNDQYPPRRKNVANDKSLHDSKPSYDSLDLFKGSQEVVIKHLGQEYRLRWTSQGKLILTK